MKEKKFVTYLPHGVDEKKFYRIENPEDLEKVAQIRKNFLPFAKGDGFIVLFVSRNMNRKMILNVCLAFDEFYKALPENEKSECALVMHTEIVNDFGTDLRASCEDLFPNTPIILSTSRSDYRTLVQLYNAADILISISSNEGWGLSITEALMSCVPVLVNVTGGMQDQMRFYDENGKWIEFSTEFLSNHNGRYKDHGFPTDPPKRWGIVVFPNNRTLVGSPQTPYISDDRCDYEEVAEKIMQFYKMDSEERKTMGLNGREWLLSEESSMNASAMAKNFITDTDAFLSSFVPNEHFVIVEPDYKNFNNPVIQKKNA